MTEPAKWVAGLTSTYPRYAVRQPGNLLGGYKEGEIV